LDGKNELPPLLVYANIDLVDFDLAFSSYSRAEVILQQISCLTEKDIDQPVRADFGEQRSLIRKSISSHNFRCRIWYLNGDQIQIGQYSVFPYELNF
jgi:hypothetical protein